jgi:hypothetical protein
MKQDIQKSIYNTLHGTSGNKIGEAILNVIDKKKMSHKKLLLSLQKSIQESNLSEESREEIEEQVESI